MNYYINKLIGGGKIKDIVDGEEAEITICTWQLGNVTLDTIPDWIDEKKGLSLAQGSRQDLIDGSSVMQIFHKDLSGVPVTLVFDGVNSALLKETVDSLISLMNSEAGNNPSLDFVSDSGTIQVAFDYTKESPIDMVYLDTNKALMKGTIYLWRIS